MKNIDDTTKLLLLKGPVKTTVGLLRRLSENESDEEVSCDLYNLASWLQGVMEGSKTYCHEAAIEEAKRVHGV